MSETFKVLQVFIASPNDLIEERRAIKEIADSLNGAFKDVGHHIQLLGWEDRLPGYGRPQKLINEDVDKADVFIGFLWKRWGSDAGNPQYTSGFEEEFKRALARREQDGNCPEICLFFKQVDQQFIRDPGDQLKKVLKFREVIEKSKKVLFRNFTDVADWKEQTRDLLQRYLLKLISQTIASPAKAQPQTPPTTSRTSPEKSSAIQKDKRSASPGKLQVTRIWGEGLEAIKEGELSEFGKSKRIEKLSIARIGLAATALTNRDIEAESPGVHLTNLLFTERKTVELTPLELVLLFKTNLIPKIGYQPGWYWIRKSKLNMKWALVFFACYDENASVREAALHYAKALNAPLREKSRWKERPIDILCSHNDKNTRKSGLEYLAEKGTGEDLQLVEKLRSDSDNDVRNQAELSRNAILLRENASHFYQSYILTSSWVSEECLLALQGYVDKIEPDLLKKALVHPDTKVQAFVAKELAKRSLITIEEIQRLNDSEGSREVLQTYYFTQIEKGLKFEPSEIRQTLRPKSLVYYGLGVDESAKPEPVILDLFRTYTYDELTSVADAWSENSAMAYRVLAEKHFDRFGARIREDLRSNFADLKAKKEEPPSTLYARSLLSGLFGKSEPDVSEFTIAALDGLAEGGGASDRELVIPFLDHKSDRIRVSAIIALRRVGSGQDKTVLLRIAEEANGDVAEEAAKTALALVPGETGSASVLVKSAKPILVKLAIQSLMSDASEKVWPQIEDRLYDENDEIRELVCAYAIKKLSIKRLGKLLDRYLAKNRYFYNVVYSLDRALYAKQPLRREFIHEIEGVLEG